LLIVKRLVVHPRIRGYRRNLRIRLGLFEVREASVYVHEVIDASLELICLTRSNVLILKPGTIVRFRRPALTYRSCNGEVIASVVKHNNVLSISLKRELCGRRALFNGFCAVHRASEYRAYLDIVFGRSGSKRVGLAMIPHMLYAMYVGGSSVKVGIANGVKNTARLFEQVFICSSILGFLPTAYDARRVEAELGRLPHVTERISVRDRLRHVSTAVSSEQALHIFVHLLLTSLAPTLRKTVGAGNRGVIPVIKFSDSMLGVLRSSKAIASEEALSGIEGEYEIITYAPGGLILSPRNSSSRIFIPYQLLRNAALNAQLLS